MSFELTRRGRSRIGDLPPAILFLIVGCLLGGCNQSSNEAYLLLEEILEAAPQVVIDLDALETTIIHPDLEIGPPDLLEGDDLFFARPSGLIILQDSLYVADGGLNTIHIAGLDGKLVRQVGTPGEGPWEFTDLFDIEKNNKYIFLHDRGKRIQVLDHNLAYVASINYVSGDNISVTDSFLIAYGSETNDMFVSVMEAHPPFQEKRTLLSTLIPPGYQPGSYNHFIAATGSTEEDFYLGYRGLPYLFVFDASFNHHKTIVFKGQVIDNLAEENPPLDAVAQQEAIRVGGFFQLLALVADRYLLFAHLNTLYVIDTNRGMYRLVKKMKFDFKEETRSKGMKGIHIGDLAYQEGKLYLTTPFESQVYRFNFDME